MERVGGQGVGVPQGVLAATRVVSIPASCIPYLRESGVSKEVITIAGESGPGR